MSETMTVYFASLTGHVLGAVTRAAGESQGPPRKAPSLEDVQIRGVRDAIDAKFLVPATELSTLTLPPQPSLPLHPLDFQVPVQLNNVQLLPQDPISPIKLEPTKVTVGVAAAVAQDEPVWVCILGGTLTAPLILKDAIKKPAKSVDITPPKTLAPGNYQVLALVTNHPASAQFVLVPAPPPVAG